MRDHIAAYVVRYETTAYPYTAPQSTLCILPKWASGRVGGTVATVPVPFDTDPHGEEYRRLYALADKIAAALAVGLLPAP